jgi:hypothetical protein
LLLSVTTTFTMTSRVVALKTGFAPCFVPDAGDDAWAGCTSAFAHETATPRKTSNKSLDLQLIKKAPVWISN